MKVFETGKNNQQPAAKAEPVRPGDDFTPEELYAKGIEKYRAGDFSEALMWYEKAAEQGNAWAQYWCGSIYDNGEGIAEDKEKALMWYEKVAEQGDIMAQNRCGDMYYNGEGTAEDKEKALMWYEKAAEDDVLAQIHFFDMYCVGDVIYAQNRCGDMYYRGEGTEADKEKALMWYEYAARQDDARAQVRCGDMYYRGEGTEADKAKALMWYEKAAEWGDVQAQLRCSEMYDKGEGTAVDREKALMWREKAEQHKMTQSRYDELQRELDYCKTIRAVEVKKMLDEAYRLGGIFPDKAFNEVKEAERCLYDRIEELEKILQQAVIL